MATTALPEKIESIQSWEADITIINFGNVADCKNRSEKVANCTYVTLIPLSNYSDIILG